MTFDVVFLSGASLAKACPHKTNYICEIFHPQRSISWLGTAQLECNGKRYQ